MTIDEHVKAVLGELTLRIAAQAAELDTLRAQVAAQAAAPPAAAVSRKAAR